MNWKINQLEVAPSEGDLTNVVITAWWQAIDEQDGFTGTVYSYCTLPAPEGEFTPYEDLTEEQVLGWVWDNGVDKDAVEAQVLAQIEDQKNPTVTTPPLPWTAPAEEPAEEAVAEVVEDEVSSDEE